MSTAIVMLAGILIPLTIDAFVERRPITLEESKLHQSPAKVFSLRRQGWILRVSDRIESEDFFDEQVHVFELEDAVVIDLNLKLIPKFLILPCLLWQRKELERKNLHLCP